jgi:hyperosmotically inducible periplasmic protein
MTRITLHGLICAGLLLGAAPGAFSQAPDNSKMNKGDGQKSAVTAGSASNNKSDREIMQEIRKSVVDDKSLSTYGHNVKIIAQHGQVTLKGPVHSDDEKQNIEAKAKQVAGDGNVNNQLTVKTK